MRVLTYNIVLGFDGRKTLPNFLHAMAYIWGNRAAIKKWSRHGARHLDFAAGFEPDVICINEVLPDIFGCIVEQKMQEAGLKTIISGTVVHRVLPFGVENRLGTYLASKWPAKQVDFSNPYQKEVGAAGGWCGMYIPLRNLTVFALHAGLNPLMRRKQFEYLGKKIEEEKNKGREVMVMGDFNASKKELSKYEPLVRLKDASLPTNRYIKYAWQRCIFPDDIDHVLWSGKLALKNVSAHEDMSDHRLLLCEFDPLPQSDTI